VTQAAAAPALRQSLTCARCAALPVPPPPAAECARFKDPVPQGIFLAELVANGGDVDKAHVRTASESSHWPAAGAGLPHTQAQLGQAGVQGGADVWPAPAAGPAMCSDRGCYCLARSHPPLLAAADALPGDHGASSEVQQALGRCCVAAALWSLVQQLGSGAS
jgi:hypothetical protein